MKLVTFNIRTLWCGDGINSFMHRIGLIYEKINAEAPDIIAFQEMQKHHLDVLTKLFPEYEFVGSGRLKSFDGEGLYTAVRRDSFDVVEKRVFWLSPTPSVPESRFPEQSIYARICVDLLLHHKMSDKVLRVYNVHLDHFGLNHTAPPSKDELPEGLKLGESLGARLRQIKLVLSEIRRETEGTDIPAVLLGDFNSIPSENIIEECRRYPLVDVTDGLDYTFHNFGDSEKIMKIDYIFMTPSLAERAAAAVAWRDEKNGIYLSDHYPVSTEIDL